LLAGSLSDLKHIFIVVDIELLAPEMAGITSFTLPESLSAMFARLQTTSPQTVVKVMLVSYGSPLFGRINNAERQNLLAGKGKPQGPAGREDWAAQFEEGN
jgi:hypothetical protein